MAGAITFSDPDRIKTPATWTGYGQVAEIIFTADTFIV